VRSERLPDCLRPRPDLDADLYQHQPAEVEVGCFVDAGRIEPPARMVSGSVAVDWSEWCLWFITVGSPAQARSSVCTPGRRAWVPDADGAGSSIWASTLMCWKPVNWATSASDGALTVAAAMPGNRVRVCAAIIRLFLDSAMALG